MLNETVTPRCYTKGATARLAMNLTEARGLLQAKSDELNVLKVALGVVCDDLQVVQAEGKLARGPCRRYRGVGALAGEGSSSLRDHPGLHLRPLTL